MLFIVNKLLAPLAPIFLVLCLILAGSTYVLYQSRDNTLKDLNRLQDIVTRQNIVISYTRDEKIKLEAVLTKNQEDKAKINSKSCESIKTLESLARTKKEPTVNSEGKQEVSDYEVLNMQLGADTIRLLNDTSSTADN
jgi:sialic acid synthase SpsE